MDAYNFKTVGALWMSNWLGLEVRPQAPTNELVDLKCGGYLRPWQKYDAIRSNPASKAYEDCIKEMFEESRRLTEELQHWLDMAVDVGTIVVFPASILMLWAWRQASRR